ncbi:hypothetical protein BH23GEM9_BH23GEM9_31440 [soil metagenome]
MNATRHVVLATVAMAILAATACSAAAQETYSWNRSLAPGQTLEIKGINGSVRAVGAGSGEARVTAVKNGRRNSPSDVIIEVVEHAGGVTLCAVYPSGRNRQPNECRPGSGGRMSVDNNDVTVQWTVRVPNGVHFVGTTVNGSVEAENLPADATARTVNGEVRVVAAGTVRASNVNGSVDVSMGRADWSGDLKLETVNGSVIARFPASLQAVVSASTTNGDIETDFPLTVTGRFGPRRLTGTVGSGGRQLELKTTNGRISLGRR